jgi:hypothetical protein
MENIPWAIGGGIVSPSIARMLAYQATSGAEGVAGIGDFTVRQLAVAGGSVRISAGGAIMVSRYPGARNESYMCRAGDETVVAIAANAGTTTRYDLVIARVDDWNMPGGQPTPTTLPTNTVPAAKFQVISNVAANVKRAKELNLNYPAIALARIAVPPATSAITTAMITSLREVAVPRRQRALLTKALVTGDADTIDATNAAGESWPNQLWTIEVPEWASRVRVSAQWNGVTIKTGSALGLLWVQLGYSRADLVKTQVVGWDTTAIANQQRQTWGADDDVAIPASMRGQSIQVGLWANITSGTGGNRNPLLDGGSSVKLDLEFLEAPAEDA